MRPVSVAITAFIGAAAANPVEWPRNYGYGYEPYPTGVSSSTLSTSSLSHYPPPSSDVPSSTLIPYPPASTSTLIPYPPASSSVIPYPPVSSSLIPYPPASSSGTGYVPYPLASTYVLSSTKGGEYPHPPPSSTNGGEYPHPPLSTGVSSSKPIPYPTPSSTEGGEYPHPTGVTSKPPLATGYPTGTEVIATYTTTTIWPVTQTSGTTVITTLTTSTVTITSCKAGCHHEPTPPASTIVYPDPSGPVTIPTTITTTTYKFVPCSKSVGHSGLSVVYSTYLTASYYPTTYVTYTTLYPQPTATLPPVVTLPPIVTPPSDCPAPVTVTVTAYPEPCKDCETKTYTVTEHGSVITITYTVPPTGYPTSTLFPPKPTSTIEPSHSSKGPKPPVPTGATGYSTMLQPSSYVPYPTNGHSSIANSSSRPVPKPTGYSYEY